MPEPLVVETSQISQILRYWVIEHQDRHPPKAPISVSCYGNNGDQQYSAMRYLVEQSCVSVKLVRRTLDSVDVYTWLSIADDLLCAINSSWILDETMIYGNPRWSRQKVFRELERRGCDVSDVFWSWLDG